MSFPEFLRSSLNYTAESSVEANYLLVLRPADAPPLRPMTDYDIDISLHGDRAENQHSLCLHSVSERPGTCEPLSSFSIWLSRSATFVSSDCPHKEYRLILLHWPHRFRPDYDYLLQIYNMIYCGDLKKIRRCKNGKIILGNT